MNYGTVDDVSSDQYLSISTFENSIGNINPPYYLNLRQTNGKNTTLVTGLSKVYEDIQLIMIWGIWLFNQYIIMIVMLNFLIAVISETYSRETERLKMHTYQFRNQLNLEFLTIRDTFLSLDNITCVIYITDKETYRVKYEEEDSSEKIVVPEEKSGEETR